MTNWHTRQLSTPYPLHTILRQSLDSRKSDICLQAKQGRQTSFPATLTFSANVPNVPPTTLEWDMPYNKNAVRKKTLAKIRKAILKLLAMLDELED